jgi:hypothetical protein
MRPRPGIFSAVRLPRLAAALLLTLPVGASRLAAGELGRPVLRHYAPGEHLRGILSQRVTQDATGLVYFANNVDLLRFDGVRWSALDLPGESAGVRQFATTEDGTIYLAGASVLGFLRGRGMDAEFVSLADQLPPEARNIDELRCAVAVGRTVYFSDERKILVWRDGRFTVVPYPSPPGSQGARLHRVGDTLYVSAPGRGLARLANDAPEVVSDDPVLRENRIVTLEAGGGGALVLLTAERGFFQLGADGRVTPYATEINRWLAGKRVFCAVRLPDGSRAVGFSAVSGDGGMRFAPDGSYAGPLDTTIGLLVKTVRDFYRDSEGGLWLGMDTGSARLEWPSEVTVFDGVNGLGQGAVADVARQEGVLYAATSEGFFRLVPDDGAGRMARFEREQSREFVALAPHPGGLLALGSNELFVLTLPRLAPLLRLPAGGTALLRSKRDPDRVWVGTLHGLRAVRHAPEGWSDEGSVPGFDESCRELAEAADGAVWVATPARGLFRLTMAAGKLAPPHVERFAGGRGLPEQPGRVSLTEIGGDTAFLASPDRVVRRYDARARLFLPVQNGALLSAPEGEGAEAVAVGADGALWVAAKGGIHLVPAAGGPSRALPHLVAATVGTVARLWEEAGPAGAVLWVGGASGLARVEVAGAFPAPVALVTQLSAKNVAEGGRLPPEHPAVTFGYFAPRQRPTGTVLYQTKLTGLERDWSEWSVKRERSFANLRAGHYRFEVRARDSDGVQSAPAALDFAVLPPWWATWWAILGYVLAGAGVIAGAVHVRTRALHQRAERLEATVEERTHQLAERTAELARQNTELIRLNQLELDEKISARLAEEKARLEVLRYQLNPHFLFNTLASISSALGLERSPARSMVERLAEFCRLTLHRSSDSDWTTLGLEMKLLRAYLEIEQSRWGELLDVEIDCGPEFDGEPLPHFLLLPLVENALKYGRATSPDRVGLRLAATRGGDGALVLEVANTGEWIEPAAEKTVSSFGIGLENLRERLARHYPRAHTLDIAHDGGWVTVTLRILAPRAV